MDQVGFGSVMNLCGMNEMKPVLENNGVLNDTMVFENVDHYWPLNGNLILYLLMQLNLQQTFFFHYYLVTILLPILKINDFVDQYPNPAKYFVSYKSPKS